MVKRDFYDKFCPSIKVKECAGKNGDCNVCRKIIKKWIAEHDAKVRADAIEEFVEKSDSAIYEDFNKSDVGEYTIADVGLTIRRVGEQLKEKKE